ncbi:MAG TPA: hypothetical protein VD794_15760 [Flavisolibacter sp.]|nr:hypothetical protein [Flavisolibacter sp.]
MKTIGYASCIKAGGAHMLKENFLHGSFIVSCLQLATNLYLMSRFTRIIPVPHPYSTRSTPVSRSASLQQ